MACLVLASRCRNGFNAGMQNPPRVAAPGRRRLLANAGLLGLLAPSANLLAAACLDPEHSWMPTDAWLTDELPRAMQALCVPGVGMAVVEAGQVLWSRNFGVTHALRQTPVSDSTLFENASLSKPMFAYVVLQLMDQGLLELDRPLVDYHRPDYVAAGPWTDRITTRDVLRHSTGLPNWRKQPATEKLLPAFKPGSAILYSGEGFFWLQLVVEQLTGQSLQQTMQAQLFGPAGMADSSYAWDEEIAARSVWGHGMPGKPLDPMPRQMLREQWSAAQPIAQRQGKPLAAWRYEDAARALAEVQALSPPGLVNWAGDIMANAAASLRTTPRDYARFLSLMMPREQRAPWELQEATRQAMLTPQLQVPGRWTDKGLGWNMENRQTGPVFYHSGSNGNIFKNFAIGDASRRRGLVVLTNAGAGNLLYRRAVRHASGHDLLDFDLP